MSVSVIHTSAARMNVSENGQEQIMHGTLSFPVACFDARADRSGIIPHWHESFEVLTVLNGVCVVCVGPSRITLREGQGLFVNSGILHAMPSDDAGRGQFHSIVFSPHLIGGGLESVFWKKYTGPLAANTELRASVFDGSEPWHAAAAASVLAAWDACALEEPGYEFAVRAALSSVVLSIARSSCAPPSPPTRRQTRSEQRVKRMMQYVHDNFAGDLSLAQICACAAVSQSEALRCFRETIGTTPMQYVKEYRLHRAAVYLADTNLSAGEIGARCGFADAAYFSRSFRAWSGMSPTEYRRQQRAAH